MQLKVAVIGAGNMGKNHIRTYSQIADIDFRAISDVNESAGSAVAKEFGVKYYKNYEELIKKESPHIVSICVPTVSHYPIAKYCLNLGINVLLEKPITMRVNEGEQLLKIALKKKAKFLVGHIERFNPAVRKVKEMIDKGELGEITAIIARRVGGFPPQIKDANIAVDLAIHDIDVINYLLGELPRKIVSNKRKVHIRKREDCVEFFIKYKKASAYIQTNWITPVKVRKLNITGTDGYLEMDYLTQQIEFFKSNYDKFLEKNGNFSDFVLRFSEPDKITIAVARKEPLKEELQYFIRCVRENLLVSSQFALDALKIALS